MLDHLDEIDRRGLALRRGFSSLFDYAVRELRFTDAAAQRRIQAMRLHRRDGSVRARLQSGDLSLTSAAQLETAFAGAERQSRTIRNLPDHDASAGATFGATTADAPVRSADGAAPQIGQADGDTADRGDAHAGTLPPKPRGEAGGESRRTATRPAAELNGNASPSLTAADVPVRAAADSDDGSSPQHASASNRSVHARSPDAAPSESLRVPAPVPESPQSGSAARFSSLPIPSAPLLHPQRQRELIEQATGMSTRQVAGLLADAAPEVAPPRDTLRAMAPDRYTLKVTIDHECERGLRQLKDLLSHLDPRMSWGDLVARLVREALARHDPRRVGRDKRRQSAGSTGGAPGQSPKKTRAGGAPEGKTTRPVGSPGQRERGAAGATPDRTTTADKRASVATRESVRLHAPDVPAARRCATGASPDGKLAAVAGPTLPAATSAPEWTTDSPRDCVTAPSNSPDTAPPPESPAPFPPGGATARASAGRAAPDAPGAPQFTTGGIPGGTGATAAAALPVAASAPEPARVASLGGGPPGATAASAARTARDTFHNRPQSPPRRHIPAAVRRHVWKRDSGRCCYRDPLSGRRCNSSHLLQIDHLLPVADGGGPEPANLALLCFAHHRLRHGHPPAPRPEPRL